MLLACAAAYLALRLPRYWHASWPRLGTHLAALGGAALGALLSGALAWRAPDAAVRARLWRRGVAWRVGLSVLGLCIAVTLAVGQFAPRDVFRAALLVSYAIYLIPRVSVCLAERLSRPPLRRVLRAADLVAFNLLLAVLLLEGGLRLVAVGTHSPLLSAPNVKAVKRIEDHRLRPGQMHLGFPANAQGFYDEEIAKEKPVGTLRILGVADSFGVETVPYPDNFLTRLESALPAADAELSPVEVVNLSVDGVSPAAYAYLLEEHFAALGADWAVACLFVGNDIGWLPQQEVALSFLRRESWYAWFVPERLLRIAAEGERRAEAENGARDNARDPDDEDLPVADGAAEAEGELQPTFSRETYLRIELKRLPVCLRAGQDGALDDRYPQLWGLLRRMRRVTQGRMLVVVIPDEFQVDDALWTRVLDHAPAPPDAYDRLRPQREIERFCEAEGIAHLDLLPALRAAHGPETPVYAPRDTHWNARGHAIAADRIAAALAERLRPVDAP
ncbi:MAG: alginate O-acetyltransferase AlgX-related protein [Planctomycetota bacterium]